MNSRQDGPYGVGGWLALLIAGMLVLGPLLGIGRTYAEFITTEHQYPALAQVAKWSSFKTVEWIAVLVFCAISIYGGLGLATKRTPDAVSTAKLVLWFNYPISIFVIGMFIPAVMIPDNGNEVANAIPSLIASLIAVGIWTAYLNRSKRVRNTYGLTHSPALEGPPPMTHESSSGAAPDRYSTIRQQTTGPAPDVALEAEVAIAPCASPQQTILDEDRIYAVIAKELETGNVHNGLWARLYADADGDEQKTKARYIKQRAERLISAERLRLEQAARDRAAEAARLEQIRLKARSLWDLLMEKDFTKELQDRLQVLSSTPDAYMILNSVEQNQLGKVSSLLSEEPLLIAVRDGDGNTPLHIAVLVRDQEMVRFLLEKGAGALALVKNNYGRTPIDHAKNSSQGEIVKLLAAHAE